MGRDNVVTVLDPRGQPTGIFGRRSSGDAPGTILSPRIRPTDDLSKLESLKMAERLDTLEGKLVFLVDTGFAGGADFLDEVAIWFSQNIPSVKTEYRKKKYDMYSDDPELWEEIKANNADAVIIGVGG